MSPQGSTPAGPHQRSGQSAVPLLGGPPVIPADAAAVNPIARVAVLLEPPHLDRTFDYWVPQKLSDQAVPGVRVRVRFAGRLVDGFLVERLSSSDHDGQLAPLRAVIDAIPVLTPQVAELVRAVAARYAGTFADVVRAAVPPRHRAAEVRAVQSLVGPAAIRRAADLEAAQDPGGGVTTEELVPAGWSVYEGATGFLRAALAGRGPRAVWIAGPGERAADRLAELVALQAPLGRGVIVIVPDAADVQLFGAALRAQGIAFEALTAAAGPQARYSAFLRILTGQRTVVLGTRAAVFAPVTNIGMIVVWEDCDESLGEPHAPGWNAREVAALRAGQSGCALVLAGHSVSVEAANLIARRWAGPIAMPRSRLRIVGPAIAAVGDAGSPSQWGSRMPPPVVAAIRDALPNGPVLLSVRRTGYLPALSCQRCRERAGCAICGRGLIAAEAQSRAGSAVQGRCPEHGPVLQWRCPACEGTRLRAAVVGAARTVEEIGRAFPGAPVIGSWGGARAEPLVTPQGSGGAALRPAGALCPLVVATPGCEPDPGPLGYQLAVILDAGAALSRPGLRTGEEVLARWYAAAALVRPGDAGGRVLVVGPTSSREVQALVRWDPLGYARRELDDRVAAGLPPAVRAVALTGAAQAAAEVAAEIADRFQAITAEQLSGNTPADPRATGLRLAGPIALAAEGTLEPVTTSPDERAATIHPQAAVRWVVSVPVSGGGALAEAVRTVQAARSARRAPVVSSRMDPRTLL